MSKNNKAEAKTEAKTEAKRNTEVATDPIAIAKAELAKAREAYQAVRGTKLPKTPEITQKRESLRKIREASKTLWAQLKIQKQEANRIREELKAVRKASTNKVVVRDAKIALLKAELAYQEACLG